MLPSVGLRAVGFPYPPTVPWWRPGDAWVSQVPGVSLPACHALETPPESPGTRHRAPLLLASVDTSTSPSG